MSNDNCINCSTQYVTYESFCNKKVFDFGFKFWPLGKPKDSGMVKGGLNFLISISNDDTLKSINGNSGSGNIDGPLKLIKKLRQAGPEALKNLFHLKITGVSSANYTWKVWLTVKNDICLSINLKKALNGAMIT
jgi:hypothetical protein